MQAHPEATALRLHLADSFGQRLAGVWRRPLREHEGLWLRPCRAVHTFGLRMRLDVLFLDADGNVLRVIHGMAPNRCSWHGPAHSVIELPGGYCRRHPCFRQVVRSAVAR